MPSFRALVTGSLSIGDEYRTTFSDYQPCRIVSFVKRTMFGREDIRFVVLYTDKKGKQHRILISPDDHLVKNAILVREFKTVFNDYEETLNKAWRLADKLWVLEQRLIRYPVTEEEVTSLSTSVVNS